MEAKNTLLNNQRITEKVKEKKRKKERKKENKEIEIKQQQNSMKLKTCF